MNIFKQFYYVFFWIKNNIWFKIKYFFEKFIRLICIWVKKAFKIDFSIPYIFKKDYIIKNSNWIRKIKAKSDYDFTINTNTEKELEWSFTMGKWIFIDIWAHIWKRSIFVANQSRDIQVYAFEPNPESYRYLKENIKLNWLENRVKWIAMWVWEKKWKLKFFAEKEMSTISHFSEKWNMEIEIIDLESFIKDNKINIKDVRLIKIDTEWFEPQVFKWMINIIDKFENVKIICELLPNQTEDKKIIENMQKKWFKLERIKETHNYIFSKK